MNKLEKIGGRECGLKWFGFCLALLLVGAVPTGLIADEDAAGSADAVLDSGMVQVDSRKPLRHITRKTVRKSAGAQGERSVKGVRANPSKSRKSTGVRRAKVTVGKRVKKAIKPVNVSIKCEEVAE